MKILSAHDIEQIFTMEEAFSAVKDASLALLNGKDIVPPRTAIHHMGSLDFETLTMPGFINEQFYGAKSWFNGETSIGELPKSAAYISLIDTLTGEFSLLEASRITDFRTGAMTGVVAEKVFASETPQKVGIIGAGIQARSQIIALLWALPSVVEVAVSGRNQVRLQKFVTSMCEELAVIFPDRSLRITAENSAKEACVESDVLVAATSSPQPVVFHEWIKPGKTLVASIGSHTLEEIELHPQIVLQADELIVDTIQGGIWGAGDFGSLISSGDISEDQIQTIGEFISRTDNASPGLTALKTVGFAAADLYAAKTVLEKAKKLDLGVDIPFFHPD